MAFVELHRLGMPMGQLLFSLGCSLSGNRRQVVFTGRRLRGEREEGNVSKSGPKLVTLFIWKVL